MLYFKIALVVLGKLKGFEKKKREKKEKTSYDQNKDKGTWCIFFLYRQEDKYNIGAVIVHVHDVKVSRRKCLFVGLGSRGF